MNRSDITTLNLRTSAAGHQAAPQAVSLINDPITPRVEIDLLQLTKDRHLHPGIAAQYAVGEVVKFINDHSESRVDIHCGNPNSTCLGGFRYTAQARQAQSDVKTLMSPEMLQTIQDRTWKNISVSQFNDPVDGNPVISYRIT